MVALAATAVSKSLHIIGSPEFSNLNLQYRSALEEWQGGHFVRRQFEAERYTRTYTNIRDYVVDRLDHDPRAGDVLDRLSSWAGDSYVGPPPQVPLLNRLLTAFISLFVQELPEGTVEE